MERVADAPLTLDHWWALMRWEIAEHTGWTLEYIEALSFEAIWEYLSVNDGNAKASDHYARQARRSSSRGRRG